MKKQITHLINNILNTSLRIADLDVIITPLGFKVTSTTFPSVNRELYDYDSLLEHLEDVLFCESEYADHVELIALGLE